MQGFGFLGFRVWGRKRGDASLSCWVLVLLWDFFSVSVVFFFLCAVLSGINGYWRAWRASRIVYSFGATVRKAESR